MHWKKQTKKIENIVFDIGNVMVSWSPKNIIERTFPEYEHNQISNVADDIFNKSGIWRQLNLGIISESDAKEKLCAYTNMHSIDMDRLFDNIKKSLTPIVGMQELVFDLYHLGYKLFALTDNVKELMIYLKEQYNFWQYFSDIVVSAELGIMKPDLKIFYYLLDKNKLDPAATVFIDDYKPNIEAAKSVSINTIQFFDTESCKVDLKKMLD